MKKTIITALLDQEKEDPSVNKDTITNDSTEEVLEDLEVDDEGNVKKKELKEAYHISQVTPMTIMTSKSPDNKDIAAVVFLCRDALQRYTFTLTINYYIENDEQKKQIENNPIHDNNNFLSKRLASNIVMNTVDGYITDMKFFYNKEGYPSNKFCLFAVSNDEKKNNEIYRFDMSADIFSAIAFIDDYVATDSHNIHDLQIATVAGYKESDKLVTVNFVDNVDSIVSLAPAATKDSEDIALVFKVIEFTDANTKNVYKILTTFNFGKKYPKKKYRGATLATLEEAYGKDVDQYLSNYMIDCHLANIDKNYLIIKAKNKNGLCKLFFLDDDAISRIEELVEMY